MKNKTAETIQTFFSSQSELATLLGGDTITPASTVKAYRLWHGLQKPNDDDYALFYQHTSGRLTPNNFYVLPTELPVTN